jgi:hypothetical protein
VKLLGNIRVEDGELEMRSTVLVLDECERESLTSSLATAPTPPRVASRIHRVEGAAASSNSASSWTGTMSDAMSASMARSPPTCAVKM